MNFLIDANLPRRLARRLTQLGHASAHISEWLPSDAADDLIWRLAVERRYVIITKDADYLHLARSGHPATPLLWLRIGNCDVLQAVALVEEHLPAIEATLATGQMIIELR